MSHQYYSGSSTLYYSLWRGNGSHPSLFDVDDTTGEENSNTITNMKLLFPQTDHLVPMVHKMSTSLWRRYFLVVNAFDNEENRRKKAELWGFSRDPDLSDKYGHNKEFVKLNFFQERQIEIFDMISGAYFTFFVTSDGIYGIGENEDGQLGVGNTINQLDFIKIESLNNLNIKKIICGAFHSMVLTNDSEVYGFGLNHWGQIGLEGDATHTVVPTKVEMFGKGKIELETIYCGEHNSFFLTTASESTNYLKQLYATGYNEFGQLTEQYKDKIWSTEPVLIDFFSKSRERTVKNMCSSYGFSFILTQSNELYSFGSQENGELGIDQKEDISHSPITKVDFGNESIRSMACGTRQVYFLSESGKVFNTGQHFVYAASKKKKKKKVQQTISHYVQTLVYQFDNFDRNDTILMTCLAEVFIIVNQVTATKNQLLAKFIQNYDRVIENKPFSDISFSFV